MTYYSFFLFLFSSIQQSRVFQTPPFPCLFFSRCAYWTICLRDVEWCMWISSDLVLFDKIWCDVYVCFCNWCYGFVVHKWNFVFSPSSSSSSSSSSSNSATKLYLYLLNLFYESEKRKHVVILLCVCMYCRNIIYLYFFL